MFIPSSHSRTVAVGSAENVYEASAYPSELSVNHCQFAAKLSRLLAAMAAHIGIMLAPHSVRLALLGLHFGKLGIVGASLNLNLLLILRSSF